MAETVIFHLDMDAFYASVEQADNPELCGKPVIVGGSSNRGVVSACSYEARKFGVHSAMPIFQARRLCPSAVILPVRMQRYIEMSTFIMTIIENYSPEIQQISIDEAFLDMSGTELLFGPPEIVAGTIKQDIRSQTGLTISIGIGSSRLIAKMASAYDKPDGLFRVPSGEEMTFLDALEISDIWGIGKKSVAAMHARGIVSIPQLRSFSEAELCSLFGASSGRYLFKAVRGIDPGIFQDNPKSRSISNEMTFGEDISDREILSEYLFDLSHQVFFRALSHRYIGKTAIVKIKYADFTSVSARRTVDTPFLSTDQFHEEIITLFNEKWNRKPVRLIGAGISGLSSGNGPAQQELLETREHRKGRLDRAVHSLQNSGFHMTKAASLLHKKHQS